MSDQANADGGTRSNEPRLAVGQRIADKYRIDRILGVGGMGVVVAATHVQLGEIYALKFLRGAGDSETIERFLREARASVRIKSEHVVRVSDVCQLPNGEPYIVMEYLSGIDLGQLLEARGPLPVRDAVDYIVQACAGIGEAHANGIVHRDLKPSNLFLTSRPDGTPLVKVLDFGISKFAVDADAPSMTQTHEVFGSPAYMPPEQIRSAKNVDARSDVWALGVILHEFLTGALPFEGATSAALLAAIAADRPRSARPSRPDVSEALDAILRRCLEKNPAARVSSVTELAVALAPFGTADSATLAQRLARRASIVPQASVDLHASAPEPVSISAFAPTEKRRARTPPLLIAASAGALTIGVLAFASALWLRAHQRRAATVDALTTASTGTTTAVTVATPSSTKVEPSTPPTPPSAPSAPASSARKRPRPPNPAECDPPYTVDSEGIRHPKAKCLSQ